MADKLRIVKTMVFPVVMYGCESWTVKKAEYQRTDAFTVVLEKTLESRTGCPAALQARGLALATRSPSGAPGLLPAYRSQL